MANIAIYKFNDGTDTLPLFNSDFEYSYTDSSNGDGTITRTITSNNVPSVISFKDLEGLVSVDYINTQGISNFSYLFQNCINLTSVDLYNIESSHITNMAYMFAGCTGFNFLDVSGLNTVNVQDMSGMFMGCSNVFSINIKDLDTVKVTSMNSMFQDCVSLSSVDMTGMNISALSNIGSMFSGCTNLMSVLFTGLNLNNNMTTTDLFKDCLVLQVINMDNCAIDDINMMVGLLPQREASVGAKLKVNNTDVSGINTTDLNAKNWNLASYEIFLRYKFDRSIYNNLIPSMSNVSGYVVLDESIDGNIVTRAIGHENLKPTFVQFGTTNHDGSATAASRALIEVLYLDTSNIITMGGIFRACLNVKKINSSDWDISKVTDMCCAFASCENLTELDVSNWNTSKVTDMSWMFYACKKLTTLDVSGWDTGNVSISPNANSASPAERGMSYMFKYCQSLTSLDLSSWNVSKVAGMRDMFAYCTNLEILNISGWTTNALTTMRVMFDNCVKLRSIIGIDNLNTSKVTDMYGLFWKCQKLQSMDLSNWNVGKVTSMNCMFYACYELKSVGNLSNWNVENVTNMHQMFIACYVLETLNIANWNTSKVTTMSYMFNDCLALKSLDLSGWNTGKVTDFNSMFNATDGFTMNLESITFGPNWNTSNVTNWKAMFQDCSKLTTIDTSMFNTSKATTMEGMFKNCKGLTSLDLRHFNVSNVTVTNAMFDGCINLESINLNGWNTSKNTNMNYMFNECRKLKSLDINHFDVRKVTTMVGLLQNMYAIEYIDLSNWSPESVMDLSYVFNATDGTYTNWKTIKLGPGWKNTINNKTLYCTFSDADKLTTIEGLEYLNTSNVTNMGWTFARCKAIETLNIANWDMSKVTDARGMFSECLKLKKLDVSKWDTSSLSVSINMFQDCRSLQSINVTNWDVAKLNSSSSMFAHCQALATLDLSGWNHTPDGIGNALDYCLSLKTLNINNIKLTRSNMNSNTWIDDNVIEKIYLNDLNNLNLLIETGDIKDRTGSSQGIIVVPSNLNIPVSTLNTLASRNWDVRGLVVQYTFDTNTYESVIPEFNPEFTSDKYNVVDEVNEYTIDNFIWEDGCLSTETGVECTFDAYPNGKRTEFIPVIENLEYKFDTDYAHVLWYNSNKAFLSYGNMVGTNGDLEISKVAPIGAKYLRLYRGDGNVDNVRPIKAKTITRTIESIDGTLPTRIRFGYRTQEEAENDTYESAHGAEEQSMALIRVSDINTDELTIMNDMFRGCRRVEEINSSKWNTSKVTEMRCTFENCLSLSKLDVSNWDTSKVTLMGWLFCNCYILSNIDVSKWDTKNCTQMQLMFSNCKLVTSLSVGHFNTSKVTHLYNMFTDCRKITTIDVSNWIVSNCRYMKGMFQNCESLTSLDLSKWNIGNVKEIQSMFENCKVLTTIGDVSNWNTGNVTNMYHMFQQCEALATLNISNWNTGNVTNMLSLFSRCSSLTSIDVSKWDVSNVLYMSGMFGLCHNLTSLDLSNWDTSKVIEMDFMFDDCISLSEIKGLKKLNTNSLQFIHGIFNDTTNIKILDLSDWNTNNLSVHTGYSNINCLFAGRDKGVMKLKTLDITNWTLPSNLTYSDLFYTSNYSTELQYIKCGTPELANTIIPFLPDRTSMEPGVLLVNSASGISSSALVAKNWNLMTVSNATVIAEYKFDDRVDKDYLPVFNNDFNGFFTIDSYEDTADFVVEPRNHVVPAEHIVTRKLISVAGLPTLMRFGTNLNDESFVQGKEQALLEINQLDCTNLTNTMDMFRRCYNLVNINCPIVTTGKLIDSRAMFYYAVSLKSIDLSQMDVSNVTNMVAMFFYCQSLTSLDLSNFDTRNVTNMHYMFGGDVQGSMNLSSITFGPNFITSNVTTMRGMFSACEKLTTIDVSGFDTSNVTTMWNMFWGCKSLTSLDVSGFNTAKVETMFQMFQDCESLTTIDVSSWNTGKVTTMSNMFNNCKSLTSLDVSNWSLNSVNSMTGMFLRCESLTSLDVSKWNTSNVKEIGSIFAYCKSLTSIDVSKWNTSNMINISCVFAGSEKLTTVGNLSNWNISKCTSLYALFSECHKLKSVPGIGTWNTSNIQNMNGIFQNCHDLTSVDVSNWDTRNATTMEDVFTGCSSLTTIDVSNWNTGKVSSMKCMFRGCHKLQSLDLSNWDTRYVIDMTSLCYVCSSLTSVGNLSNWNTSKVLNMNLMFGECHNLTSIDVSNWDTRNVTNMYGMFWNCRSLESLDLSNFDTKLLSNSNGAIAMIGQLLAAKTINLNNVSITQAQADIFNDSRFFLYNNSLEKLYINKLETLATLIGYLVDRTGKTPGKLVTSIREVIPADIMAILNARNWQIVDIVAQYRYNPDRYSDLMPTFNTEFKASDYVISDTTHNITLTKMFWENGIIGSNGANATDSNYANAARSAYLPVIGALTYEFNIDYCQVYWYDKDKNLLLSSGLHGTTNGIANGSKCHAPTDAVYLRIYRGAGSVDNVSITTRFIDRIIEATGNKLPARFIFGLNADSGEYTLREASLVDVIDVNMINVYDCTKMFAYCNNVKRIRGNWRGTHMTNMYDMFAGCYYLQELDLSDLVVSNVGRMEHIFLSCANLTTIGDTTNWNTKNATSFSDMFRGCTKLQSINATNWKTDKVNNMREMFYGCNKLTTVGDISNWNTGNVTQMYDMFYGCNKLGVLNLSDWNVGKVQNMSRMFMYCSELTTVGDLSKWDTSKVENMNCMFSRCTELTTVGDISNWNISKCYNLHDMFGYCEKLQSLDLSKWDTSNVNDMSGMFIKCHKLTSIGDISNWDVRKVNSIAWMFEYAQSLTKLDFSNWQTDSLTKLNSAFAFTTSLKHVDLRNLKTNLVTDTNNMFTGAGVVTLDISNFDLSNVTNSANMFANATNLKYLKCKNANTLNVIRKLMPTRTSSDPGYIIYRGDLSKVDTSVYTARYWNFANTDSQLGTVARYRFDKSIYNNTVPEFNSAFYGFIEDESVVGNLVTRKIEHIKGVLPTSIKFGYSGAWEDGGSPRSHSLINVYELDTSNAIDLWHLFRLCINLETIECKLIAEKVQYMTGIFNCCYKLKSVDVSGIKTDNINSLNTVFCGCKLITTLDLGHWNISKVTDIHQLFGTCTNLQVINGLEKWDTSNVVRMSEMFSYCSNLTSLNIQNWNTGNSNNMGNMFIGCTKLQSLDLSNWDVRNVTIMTSMFRECKVLTSIGDVGNWNTGKVTLMETMFYECYKLKSVNVANWDMSNVCSVHYMFYNCQALTSLAIDNWDTHNIQYMGGLFNGCKGISTFNVGNWDTGKVLQMNWLFGQTDTITIIGIENWDTSKVTTMCGMFANTGITGGLNITNFNTSEVTIMEYMFYNCWKIKELDVSNFDTRKVEDMDYMFERCGSLKTLDLSNFDTRAIRVADKILMRLEAIETLNLNNIDLSDVEFPNGFFSSPNNTLNKLYVNSVDTLNLILPSLPDRTSTTHGKVMTSIRRLIPQETIDALTSKNWIIYDIVVQYTFDANRYENLLPEFNLDFDEDDYTIIDSVSEVKLANFDWVHGGIYDSNGKFVQSHEDLKTEMRTGYISIEPNATYKVEYLCPGSKVYCYNINKEYIGHIAVTERDGYSYITTFENTAFVALKTMTEWYGTDITKSALVRNIVNRTIESVNGKLPTMIRFGVEGDGVTDNATERSLALLSVLDMNTANITVGSHMFRKCKNLTKVCINHFIVPENAKDIFAECESLERVDVSNWNTDNVTTIRGIFCYCYKLKEIIGLENWNTSNVTDMHGVFNQDNNLNSINISNWNTSNVTNMRLMFDHCGLLSSLNLSGWNTSKVTDMHAMFSECKELTTIGDIEKWETANVTNMSYMFNCCIKLETQSISNWNTSNVTRIEHMFSNCYEMTRIDVSGWDTSKVTDMNTMFNNINCNIMNIANFNTDSITGTLTSMFRTTNVTNPPLVRLNLPSHDINVELGENFLMNQTNLKYVKCESKNNIVKVVSHLPSRPANNPGKIFTKIPLSEFTDIVISTLANKNWAIVSVNEGLKVLAKYRFAKNIWGSVLPKINSTNDTQLGFVNYFIEDEMLDTVDEVIRFNVTEESQQTIPASEIVTRTIYVMEGDIASTSNKFLFGPHGAEPTHYMRKHASAMLSIDELDLSQFSQLTGLVRNCSNLKSLNITQYPTVPLSTLESAFASAKSLPTLDVSNFDVSLVQSLQWTFYDMMYVTQITGLENWNTPNLKYMRCMFDRCYQLTSLNLSGFNTANVVNMYCLFANCQRLTEIVGIENFITTNVKDMGGMFANCQSLPSLDVSGFDTRNVEQMSCMFQNCLLLPIIDVSGFDTSKVMQIERMFEQCKNVKVLDVSNWDVSNVTNMKQTFHHCYGLTSLDVSNWNTSNTTIMDGTFRYCIALNSIDVSKWDTSKVKYMESIFGDCWALTTLDLSDWDISKVIDADWMVGAMNEIRTINLNNIVLNDNCTIGNFFTRDSKLERVYMNNIDTLNKLVSKLPDRSETTTGKIIMPNKDQVPAETVALLNGKNWHLGYLIASYKYDSNVYEDLIPVFSTYFSEDKYVVVDTNNSKGVITRNIESVEGKLPDCMRFGRLSSTQPENGCLLEICDMNTDKLVTTEHMFDWCANLTKVNTKHFNTSNVTNMVSMFYQCESLTSLDVSGFDTSNVLNMSHMFGKCKSLTSIDVSKWNTSEVRIMEHLFAQCESLTSIDVSNFDTRNVWIVYDMFCDCHSLATLDVSNFDTSKVTDMSGAFARCYNLTDLDVSNWTADNVTLYGNLLSNTNGLLTKITLNDLELANMIITYLPDRTGKEAGTLAYYDIDPALIDTTTLQAKNWNLSYEPIMAKYIFNSNEFENFLPMTPNYTKSNYEIIDDVKADGRVIRTLKYRNNLRPTHIRFGESHAESNLVKMRSLKNVIYLDIKDNITSMDNLLANARSLIRVNTRNWDTSNITDMYCAFFHCQELKEIDVCDWDVRKVEKMQFLFHNCRSITQLDLQNWHTNSVKTMHNMFCECNNLVDLDLSSFNTSKVINMDVLFLNCYNLKSLNLNGFDMNKLENSGSKLFGGCTSLDMIEVNNCDIDTINKIVSKLPSRDGKVFGKLYAIRGVEHSGINRPSDNVNWRVVIRGGNIKSVHIPEELLNTIGLGNNVLLRHIHIGERFL